jgi:hypothetical protein
MILKGLKMKFNSTLSSFNRLLNSCNITNNKFYNHNSFNNSSQCNSNNNYEFNYFIFIFNFLYFLISLRIFIYLTLILNYTNEV